MIAFIKGEAMNLPEDLKGGDLRSIGNSHKIITQIKGPQQFDALFRCLYHTDRIVVMRAADMIEKMTRVKPNLLLKHKREIFDLSKKAKDKELKWHLAQMFPRLEMNKNELGKVWERLTLWANDRQNSRIVRVNAVQSLFELCNQETELLHDLQLTMLKLEKENIPSLNARIRKISKQISKRNLSTQ